MLLPSSRYKDCRPSFRICIASLIYLVLMSDSLSKIVVAGQLITWLSWDAWSVSADLFYSDRLDARWFLVKGLLVMDSISVLCSFNLVPPSSLSYVTFLTARTWNVYMQSVISCSCLSFGCTSSVFKVFTGLTATGTWSFLITRAILSDIPSTQGRMTRRRFAESLSVSSLKVSSSSAF